MEWWRLSTADELIQSPGQEFDLLRDSILKDLHVAMPGVVRSFNDLNHTATVQLAIRSRKDGKNMDVPLLLDVPVFFPGGSAGTLTYPIESGDECLVVFADSCIDSWFQNGGVSNAISLRKHDYSDGFAFVGFRSKATGSGSQRTVRSAITVNAAYNAADQCFPVDVPAYGNYQQSVVARNTENGSMYAMWYDASVGGFRPSVILSGSVPENGQHAQITYTI